MLGYGLAYDFDVDNHSVQKSGDPGDQGQAWDYQKHHHKEWIVETIQ